MVKHTLQPMSLLQKEGWEGTGLSGKEKTRKIGARQELGVEKRQQQRRHLTFFRQPKETFGWKAVVEARLAIIHFVHS